MAEQRLARKDIKEPDQFLSASVQVIHWLHEHTKYLIYSSLGLIIMAGLVIAWSTWHKNRERQATTLFYETQKLLNTGSGTAKEADRSSAQEKLAELIRDYGNTSVSVLAYWHLGQLAFESRDYTKALHAYQQAHQKISPASNPPMFATITLGIGYVQEASGMYNQAIANFDAVLQSSAHWLRGEAYMGLGRCYRALGSIDQASALTQRVLSDKNLSELSRKNISEQLTSLR